jgi:hypothetical protein
MRYRSPNFGFFASPDLKFDVSMLTPSSWNQRAYVRSNPLKFVDPMGLEIPLWTCPIDQYCPPWPDPEPVGPVTMGMCVTMYVNGDPKSVCGDNIKFTNDPKVPTEDTLPKPLPPMSTLRAICEVAMTGVQALRDSSIGEVLGIQGTQFAGFGGSGSGSGLSGQGSVQWGIDGAGNLFRITTVGGGPGGSSSTFSLGGGFGAIWSSSSARYATQMSAWGSQAGGTGGAGWYSIGGDMIAGRHGMDPSSEQTYTGYDLMVPTLNYGLELHSIDFSYSWVREYGNLRDLCKSVE